jgi:hypothetical protein
MTSASRVAPDLFTHLNGTRFAYRCFGRPDGVPLVLLSRFRGTMDDWDPLFVDALAEARPVILFAHSSSRRASTSSSTVPGRRTPGEARRRRGPCPGSASAGSSHTPAAAPVEAVGVAPRARSLFVRPASATPGHGRVGGGELLRGCGQGPSVHPRRRGKKPRQSRPGDQARSAAPSGVGAAP